jgi:hypothetical protein
MTMHQRAEEISGQNVWTVCGRVVHPNHTRLERAKVTCEKCLKEVSDSYSYEITDVGRTRKKLTAI